MDGWMNGTDVQQQIGKEGSLPQAAPVQHLMECALNTVGGSSCSGNGMLNDHGPALQQVSMPSLLAAKLVISTSHLGSAKEAVLISQLRTAGIALCKRHSVRLSSL